MKVFWILGIIFGVLFAIGGIVLAICDIFLIGEGIFLIFGLVLSGIGIVAAVLARKSVQAEAKAEQELRKIHGDAYVDAIIQKNNKIMKRIGIVFVIVMIVVSIPIAISTIQNDDYKSNSGGCRNCGRKTDLVVGYNFCYDCYEGFIDWQENNWKED